MPDILKVEQAESVSLELPVALSRLRYPLNFAGYFFLLRLGSVALKLIAARDAFAVLFVMIVSLHELCIERASVVSLLNLQMILRQTQFDSIFLCCVNSWF